jgi:hypothetical protein
MPRRRRHFSRLELVYFLVGLGLLLGGSIWLDRNGSSVIAAVSSKREEIAVHDSPRGEWSRWYRVGVDVPRGDGIVVGAIVTVPRERFDSLRVGDRIAIRYLPALPLYARAADRSTAQVVGEGVVMFLGDSFLTRILLWLVIGAALLWLMARVATAAVFAAGAVWIVAAFPLLFPAAVPIRLGTAETTARVEDVRLVTKSPEGRYARTHGGAGRVDLGLQELPTPYRVVRFRFAAPGQPDSVRAIDAVDASSVPGLGIGSILPARYEPEAPREARLSLGARSFRERNRYHGWIWILGVGLLLMFGAAAWSEARRRAPWWKPVNGA